MSVTKYIPSFITSLNLAFGFVCITLANNPNADSPRWYLCSIVLMFCMLFDTLDGYLARKLNASSSLGKELDSLADMVSFGIAPAYVYYLTAPGQAWYYIIPATLIVVASGLRLARFNLLPSYDYFQGLPTPANAFFFIGIFLALHHQNELVMQLVQNPIVYFTLPIIFGLLMLSSLRMFSLKGLERPFIKNRYQISLVLFFIILLLIEDKLAIPFTVIMFILLSVIQSSRRKL